MAVGRFHAPIILDGAGDVSPRVWRMKKSTSQESAPRARFNTLASGEGR
jgi:hypothetical protein